MALTPLGKKYVLDTDMKTARLFVGLAASSGQASNTVAPGGTVLEHNGQGYARKAVPGAANERAVSAAGVLALAASQLPLTVFTPSSSGAPDFTHAALFNAGTGAHGTTQLTHWTPLTDQTVNAPVNGQPYRLNALTLAL